MAGHDVALLRSREQQGNLHGVGSGGNHSLDPGPPPAHLGITSARVGIAAAQHSLCRKKAPYRP